MRAIAPYEEREDAGGEGNGGAGARAGGLILAAKRLWGLVRARGAVAPNAPSVIEPALELKRLGRKKDAQFLQCAGKRTLLGVPGLPGALLRKAPKLLDDIFDQNSAPESGAAD